MFSVVDCVNIFLRLTIRQKFEYFVCVFFFAGTGTKLSAIYFGTDADYEYSQRLLVHDMVAEIEGCCMSAQRYRGNNST